MARNPAAAPNPAQVAQEQADCFKLKLAGASVREIAAETGIPKSTVQERLQAAYDDLVLPVADEVRQLELARLDSWHRKLEARLSSTEEPEKVVPALLRCQERRSKYLGLDAPERQEVTTTVLPAADDAVEVLLAQGRQAAYETP